MKVWEVRDMNAEVLKFKKRFKKSRTEERTA